MAQQHPLITMTPRAAIVLLALVIAVAGSGCASKKRGAIPPGTAQPDQFLFDKGNENLQKKKWVTAREFYKQLTETYTQSPLRPDAKLAIGDSYLGEGGSESVVLAINEFQEFLSFYPTHGRADYAQYKLAMAHFRQMRAPERDQTETRDTIHEFETFLVRYPNSELMPEVKSKLREARDRLSEADYGVGVFYFRQKWYPGAIERLQSLIKTDPEFTGRDGAYFYLAESLMKVRRQAEALPYYQRIIDEFEQSEHLGEAKRRVATLTEAPAEDKAAKGPSH
jgi:outer membrane protein assembly factor BamD